jgi:hypothetical protein
VRCCLPRERLLKVDYRRCDAIDAGAMPKTGTNTFHSPEQLANMSERWSVTVGKTVRPGSRSPTGLLGFSLKIQNIRTTPCVGHTNHVTCQSAVLNSGQDKQWGRWPIAGRRFTVRTHHITAESETSNVRLLPAFFVFQCYPGCSICTAWRITVSCGYSWNVRCFRILRGRIARVAHAFNLVAHNQLLVDICYKDSQVLLQNSY